MFLKTYREKKCSSDRCNGIVGTFFFILLNVGTLLNGRTQGSILQYTIDIQ
jgi:hypothetical protein